MAGYKVSDYALGNDKWSNFLTTIEKQRKGFIALSLTNYDNNSLPAIASGSYVEINGALYGFDSEEAINGTPTSGSTNYIYIDPSDIKPYWTTTAPTWSNNKSGWYDSTETKRYIGACYYDGTNYTDKIIYQLFRVRYLDDILDGSVYKKIADANNNNHPTRVDDDTEFENYIQKSINIPIIGSDDNHTYLHVRGSDAYADSGHGGNVFIPIVLPINAEMIEFTAKGYVNSGGSVSVSLDYSPLDGSSSYIIAHISSNTTGDFSLTDTVDSGYETVNSARNYYFSCNIISGSSGLSHLYGITLKYKVKKVKLTL